MRPDDARALIEHGIPTRGGAWADLGAGTGTFTTALAGLIGASGTVYAVERDPAALHALRSLSTSDVGDSASIHVIEGDFTRDLDLPPLSGILAANALHFVPRDEQARLLVRLASQLDTGGRVLLVEYDRERGNPWVPHPISRKRLAHLARDASFEEPTFLGALPSEYGGELYSAVLVRGA